MQLSLVYIVCYYTYIIILIEPEFTELSEKFTEVSDWESICRYLIDDNTGQRTKEIRKSFPGVKEKRDEMLRIFLRETYNPTWKDITDALRAGRHNNLADEIESELSFDT